MNEHSAVIRGEAGEQTEKIFWAEFTNVFAETVSHKQGSWDEFCARLCEPVGTTKKALPLVKLAQFGTKRTEKGSLRHDANTRMVTGLEADYDAGEISLEEAVTRLERAQIRAVVTTTPSHRPDKPRWRAFAPTSRAIHPEDRYRLMARLNGALGGILAGESFTLSQSFYFGQVQGVPFKTMATFDGEDGSYIDELDKLDKIAIGKRDWKSTDPLTGEIGISRTVDLGTFKAEVQERGRKLRTGDGRRDMLKSLIGHLSGQFQENQEIKDTLRALVAESFDPADPVDWSDIDALVDNISAKDAELRALGARHAKNIMESAKLNALAFSPAGEPAGTVTMSTAENWLDAVKDYKAPLHHWKQPPPIRWAVDELIREGVVGTVIAPGATGKTTLLITLGICHALGRPFLGRGVKQGGFLLLSLDDGQEDLDAAIGQVMDAMGLSDSLKAQAGGYLRVISLQGKTGPRSFNLPGSPGAPNPDMQRILMEACLHTPSLVGVCVDTLRQFAGGPTNAEEVIMQVSSICASIATQTGAYVAIPHHTGKAGAREDQGDMYAGSGSAAIADNARFVLVLERVRERNDLARLSTTVQQDQNAGLCDVLRLSSRRGSIRHKPAEDLYIARHGYLMEVAQAQEMSGEARTIQILAAIAAEVKAGDKPSKNGLYKTLGGNRNKLFAEIDELIECGLVSGSDYERRAGSTETSPQKTISKDGLTAAGWALLKDRQEQ